MRGDSLRDFYAKSLALLGLAALAGIGALVDYWPADLAVPRDVARALPPPSRPASAPKLSELADVAAFIAERTPAAIARPLPRRAPVAVATALPAEIAAGSVVTTPAPPPPPAAFDVTPASAVPATVLALTAPLPPPLPVADPVSDVALAPVVELAEPAPIAAPVDGSPAQVVTGALSWMGQSILQAGAKTGETIGDALRAFKGAFRKVPWFSSAPASRPIG